MQKSIGQRLSAARKQKKLTLDSISEEIYIKKEFLELMERDRFDLLPSVVQARGFLRLYSDFLKLDTNSLLSQLIPRDTEQSQIFSETEQPPTEQISVSEEEPHFLSKVLMTCKNIILKLLSFFRKKPFSNLSSIEPGQEAVSSDVLQKPNQVYKEIGSEIQKNREIIGLTLDEMEMATTIKKKHLEWIENGLLDNFSSPIQARGLLQNYVKYMGMDLDAIMLRYANAILSARQGFAPGQNQSSKITDKKKRYLTIIQFLSPNLLIAIFLLASMVCLLGWGINRISTDTYAKATISAPPISEILLSTQEPTKAVISIGEATEIALTEENIFVTPVLLETIEENITPETPTPSGQMFMNISVNQRTYLLVIIDGVEKINARVKAGDTFQYSANERIELAVGSAAAISVVYGQNDLGIMGNPGEAIHLIFTANGAFTPTPKSSPTPTSTKAATPTSTPTPTIPTPTITPLIP